MNQLDAETLQCVLDQDVELPRIDRDDESDLGGLLYALGHHTEARQVQHVQTAGNNLHRLNAVTALCHDLARIDAEPILLPGAALLRLYPDVGCRSMEDIDLLVEASMRSHVVDALERYGWQTLPRHPDLFTRLDGCTIHLHTDLLNGDRLTNRRRAGWIEPSQAKLGADVSVETWLAFNCSHWATKMSYWLPRRMRCATATEDSHGSSTWSCNCVPPQ